MVRYSIILGARTSSRLIILGDHPKDVDVFVRFRRKNGIKNTTQKDCCDKDERVAAKDMRVF